MSESQSTVSGRSGAWDEFRDLLESRTFFGVEPGLRRMRRALEATGLSGPDHDVILVAGTNGKGETSAYLSSLLTACGRTTGLYTSPHLVDVVERVRIDGTIASVSLLCAASERVLEYVNRRELTKPPEKLTYFELTTLLARSAFIEAGVDVGVYEVGLGGRLDATNALDPSLGLITSVAKDHEAVLGPGLAEIARQKAGIARAGRPVVVGRQNPEALKQLQLALPEEARIHTWGRDYGRSEGNRVGGQHWTLPIRKMRLGECGIWNAASAMEAASIYLDAGIQPETGREAIRRCHWPGRRDRWILGDSKSDKSLATLVVDVAHNEQAARHSPPLKDGSAGPFDGAICAGLSDKDLGALFDKLDGLDCPVYLAELEQTNRAATHSELRRAMPKEVDVAGHGAVPALLETLFADLEDLEVSLSNADGGTDCFPTQRWLVFGSCYLAGELFGALGADLNSLY